MYSLTLIQKIAIFVLPILLAITLHEAAHGWMAKKLGDRTAEMMGRVTLNPLKHIDPIGTIVVPFAVYMVSGFIFGWAKPVPINWRNLHNPRRDVALVALAGPAANLLMAFFWSLMIHLGFQFIETHQWFALPLMLMGVAGVLINTLLMALNLIPIPPLDGGRILTALLPPKMALTYASIERYGLFIMVALLASGILGTILTPLVTLTLSLLPASDIVSQLLPVILNPARS